MRGRTTFAEELDDALRAERDRGPYTPEAPRLLPPPPPFLFTGVQPHVRSRTTERILRGPDGTIRPGSPGARGAAPARVSRTLTEVQRDALDGLVASGADLHTDFTRADLRRAFRSLARQYHPDRHPTGTPDDKTRLSSEFARLSDHYRCLLTLVER
jgi:hypothetical protein